RFVGAERVKTDVRAKPGRPFIGIASDASGSTRAAGAAGSAPPRRLGQPKDVEGAARAVVVRAPLRNGDAAVGAAPALPLAAPHPERGELLAGRRRGHVQSAGVHVE